MEQERRAGGAPLPGLTGTKSGARLTSDTPLIAAHRSPLAATGPQVIPLCTSGIPVLATPLGKDIYGGFACTNSLTKRWHGE